MTRGRVWTLGVENDYESATRKKLILLPILCAGPQSIRHELVHHLEGAHGLIFVVEVICETLFSELALTSGQILFSLGAT